MLILLTFYVEINLWGMLRLSRIIIAFYSMIILQKNWFVSHSSIKTVYDINVSFSSWFMDLFNVNFDAKLDRIKTISFIFILLWNIWNACNVYYFEKKGLDMSKILLNYCRLLKESRPSFENLKVRVGVAPTSFWTPPPKHGLH